MTNCDWAETCKNEPVWKVTNEEDDTFLFLCEEHKRDYIEGSEGLPLVFERLRGIPC